MVRAHAALAEAGPAGAADPPDPRRAAAGGARGRGRARRRAGARGDGRGLRARPAAGGGRRAWGRRGWTRSRRPGTEAYRVLQVDPGLPRGDRGGVRRAAGDGLRDDADDAPRRLAELTRAPHPADGAARAGGYDPAVVASPSAVHPLQPRFAQAITGVLCLEALVFQTWPGGGRGAGAGPAGPGRRRAGRRWRGSSGCIARPPAELEPAAPVRFSQAHRRRAPAPGSCCPGRGADVAGWILVGLVAAVALFSAITGLLRRLRGLPPAARCAGAGRPATCAATSGWSGDGPWLVVLTAPGCAPLRAGGPGAGARAPAAARCCG